jgi:hypothetical protein
MKVLQEPLQHYNHGPGSGGVVQLEGNRNQVIFKGGSWTIATIKFMNGFITTTVADGVRPNQNPQPMARAPVSRSLRTHIIFSRRDIVLKLEAQT